MEPAEQAKPGRGGMAASTRGRPLAWRLVILCAAVTAPILCLVAVLLTQYAASERDRLGREGIAAVKDIAVELDRDVSFLTTVLQTLSYSTRLPERDFAGFHRLASLVTRDTGLPVVLSDLTGQQIVNTRVPYGTDLPRVAISYDEVIRTKKPVVFDLFRGAVVQRPIFSLAMPVPDPATGDVEYVLNLSIDPARLRDKLLAAPLLSHAVASVIDRDGRLMARTVGGDDEVGARPTAFLDAAAGRSEGQVRFETRDGARMVAAFTKMKSTGWTVVYEAPVSVIDRPWRALVGQLMGLALLSALVAGAGGFVYSRRIVGALASLGHSADEVGRGRIVAPVRTPVTEINLVGERLALASHDLRQITDAKDALLYEVNHRVKNSLAVVTSLLAMHARQTHDDGLKRGLEDVRARIDVIASVHQRLYQSGLHDRLDLGLFLQEIAAEITQALGGSRFRLVCDCETGIVIGVDRTTPLALIVGEWLTNALKHGARAEVRLSVRRAGQGDIVVAVGDDGPGLPSGFVIGKTAGAHAGVGMRIVSGLARQLRGRVATNAGEEGARFQITLQETAG